MTARATLAFFRLWAVALLAVVGLQALQPVPAPLERVSGSAFSAATIDVALVSERRSETADQQAVPTPVLSTPWLGDPISRSPQVIPAIAHLRPAVRGPPPRDGAARLPDLRGPPLA